VLSGKGFFIWQISRVEGGNVTTIADLAVAARLKHILIKIGDGVEASNVSAGTDLVPPLVTALKARGLEVWGWHYLYGDRPVEEASLAAQRISQTTHIIGVAIIKSRAKTRLPGPSWRPSAKRCPPFPSPSARIATLRTTRSSLFRNS
jgi:hypothetical protein